MKIRQYLKILPKGRRRPVDGNIPHEVVGLTVSELVQPGDTEPAMIALGAYFDASGTDPDVIGEDITDLVADLLLLAEDNDIDPDKVMRDAVALIEERHNVKLWRDAEGLIHLAPMAKLFTQKCIEES